MDLLSLGSQSRKTGLKARENVRKDRHNMEDIDEFFQEDTDDSFDDATVAERQSIVARKINFTDAETEMFDNSLKEPIKKQRSYSLKSPLLDQGSPSGKLQSQAQEAEPGAVEILEQPDQPQDYDDGYAYDDLNNNILDELNSPEPEDPPEISSKSVSLLTKNMALGKPTNSKRIRKKSVATPRAPRPQLTTVSVRPSPLPLPPPDGLRRSKRTRIQPLAFWRNERVVYSRSHEEENEDPDLTIVQDIQKVPLQEIKEIIHVEDPTTYRQESKRRKSSSKKLKKPSNKKKNGDVEYDYESDPEVNGSEWFDKKSLSLPVYESNESETLDTKPIAFTQEFEEWVTDPPKSSGSSIDNYKLAAVFDDNPNVAGALLHFPQEGFKSSKNSGNCIYMFHVIKGLLEVNLSNNTFVVTRGCSFQVPRGNTYGISNIGNGDAKLFCAQYMVE